MSTAAPTEEELMAELLAEKDAEIAERDGIAPAGDTVSGSSGDDAAQGAAGDDTSAGATGDDSVPGAADTAQPAVAVVADDAEAKAELDALVAQRAELRKKWDDGDLTSAEYDAQKDEINDKINKANAVIVQAANDRTKAEKAALAQWHNAVDTFLADDKNAIFRGDGPLNAALDAQIRRMNADAETRRRFPNDLKRLEEAKRIVIEEARKALGVSAPAAPAKPSAPAKPRAAAPAIPPSVDDIPPAADERESEFAHIDRMSPAQREAAVAKMSPEQYERYSRAM